MQMQLARIEMEAIQKSLYTRFNLLQKIFLDCTDDGGILDTALIDEISVNKILRDRFKKELS